MGRRCKYKLYDPENCLQVLKKEENFNFYAFYVNLNVKINKCKQKHKKRRKAN